MSLVNSDKNFKQNTCFKSYMKTQYSSNFKIQLNIYKNFLSGTTTTKF